MERRAWEVPVDPRGRAAVALSRWPNCRGDCRGAFGNDPVRLLGAPSLNGSLHCAGVFVDEAIGMPRFNALQDHDRWQARRIGYPGADLLT
jgi:hypothetical protein